MKKDIFLFKHEGIFFVNASQKSMARKPSNIKGLRAFLFLLCPSQIAGDFLFLKCPSYFRAVFGGTFLLIP